ncbi:MAG: glycoside hydrolase family 127 protein [Anaerolineae bacterium]|nr:glycoside hydrolase family 127 protein [Anaerolineae bacterium]
MHVLTKTSTHNRWRTLPLSSISVTGGFWGHKQAVNHQASIPHGFRKLEASGNFNNLRLAAGGGVGEYKTPVFMDSDVYKWLEAVAYDLANGPDPEIQAMADTAIDLVEAAQMDDGYLNSYYQVLKPDRRWTDLAHDHELYCAGHLFEAAVAMHRATGDERLLNVSRRFADHVAGVFGPGKRDGAPGHPEIELALVELYRETGERRYLGLATFFVDQRGTGQMGGYGRWGASYHQDHVPVRDADTVTGHAVRQLYLTAGVTDLYLETGDATLLTAMERLWHDMTAHRMHLTAGFGARFTGESFGDAYELPSDRCYCETCAAIAALMWNWRMLLVKGEMQYADLLERSLYNGFLSGVSLDGHRYFYVNPLQSRGGIERPEWYGCACCPPNVMRLIAVVGHYAATVSDDGVQLHQYLASKVDTRGATGPQASFSVETDYPWNGDVRITIDDTDGAEWELALRVPGWCPGATISVNGEAVEGQFLGGAYATVKRAWQVGDLIELHLAMAPRLTAPNPRIDAVRGSIAVERGPLVYCLEAVDQADIDLLDVSVDPGAKMTDAWQADLLDGVVTVQIPGNVAEQGEWEGVLYLPAGVPAGTPAQTTRPVTLTAVPYYAWANRGPGAMRVWIPKKD